MQRGEAPCFMVAWIFLCIAEPIGECSPPPLVDVNISAPSPSPVTPPLPPLVDIDQATESNHDTALTIAAAGGYDELVQVLLARNANIEHRDKKGKLLR